MSNTIRTFIAIDINPAIRKALQQLQDDLKQCDCRIKWIQPDNIHLTLKFLGDVKLKKIDDVNQALEDLAQNIKPFETELTETGAFPSIDRPQILWAGLKDDQQQIADLAASLENKLGMIGFKKEQKKFSPHITIGRIRTPRNLKALSQELSGYSLPTGISQSIQEVILVKSTLTSTGPIYEKLKTFRFRRS